MTEPMSDEIEQTWTLAPYQHKGKNRWIIIEAIPTRGRVIADNIASKADADRILRDHKKAALADEVREAIRHPITWEVSIDSSKQEVKLPKGWVARYDAIDKEEA